LDTSQFWVLRDQVFDIVEVLDFGTVRDA
jgi:hypothetical protein